MQLLGKQPTLAKHPAACYLEHVTTLRSLINQAGLFAGRAQIMAGAVDTRTAVVDKDDNGNLIIVLEGPDFDNYTTKISLSPSIQRPSHGNSLGQALNMRWGHLACVTVINPRPPQVPRLRTSPQPSRWNCTGEGHSFVLNTQEEKSKRHQRAGQHTKRAAICTIF